MEELEKQERKKPIIISFDLEVSPALGYFYPPTWETGILKIVERQKLISFAWQDVSKKKIHGLTLQDMPGYKKNPRDDKKLTEKLHEVLSTGDILLGQNSDQFDVKMANYFFIKNGLGPIPPTKFIDTKKVAKRYFRFPNNSLDTLAEELGHEGKSKTTYKDLWVDAFLEQDSKAWRLLNKYCKNDVDQTTKIYFDMRPFMKTHPNLARITGDYDACPICGSYSYRVKAYRTTNASRYRQYVCNDCNSYFSDRKAITEKQGDNKPKFVSV